MLPAHQTPLVLHHLKFPHFYHQSRTLIFFPNFQMEQILPDPPETTQIGRSLGHPDNKTKEETETKEQNAHPKRQTQQRQTQESIPRLLINPNSNV